VAYLVASRSENKLKFKKLQQSLPPIKAHALRHSVGPLQYCVKQSRALWRNTLTEDKTNWQITGSLSSVYLFIYYLFITFI